VAPLLPVPAYISRARHPYVFNLPNHTAVCAARPGIVALINEASSRNRRSKSNHLVVLHDDGSYAWYKNLVRYGAVVRQGQRVAQGDTLSFSAEDKHHLLFFFAVQYPGPQQPRELPVTFGPLPGQ
jgi:hypothetical protein